MGLNEAPHNLFEFMYSKLMVGVKLFYGGDTIVFQSFNCHAVVFAVRALEVVEGLVFTEL